MHLRAYIHQASLRRHSGSEEEAFYVVWYWRALRGQNTLIFSSTRKRSVGKKRFKERVKGSRESLSGSPPYFLDPPVPPWPFHPIVPIYVSCSPESRPPRQVQVGGKEAEQVYVIFSASFDFHRSLRNNCFVLFFFFIKPSFMTKGGKSWGFWTWLN